MTMTRKRRIKRLESQSHRRWPKHMPSKLLHSMTFIDWPHAGPKPGRGLRKFVKIARLREERLAWRTERESE